MVRSDDQGEVCRRCIAPAKPVAGLLQPDSAGQCVCGFPQCGIGSAIAEPFRFILFFLHSAHYFATCDKHVLSFF